MPIVSKKGRVCIVEHEPQYMREFRHSLRRDYEIFSIKSTHEDPIATIESIDPAIVVIAGDFPKPNGIEIIKAIRARDELVNAYTGIVLAVSEGDSSLISAGAAAGSDNFCIKRFAKTQLRPLVHTAHRLHTMTDALKSYSDRLLANNAELEQLCVTDELTGLFNMRYVKQKLAEEFEAAKRHKTLLAVLMIDIDHFKQVNDEADHLLGSYVIGEVGREIYRVTRRIDIPGRYGGDEFIIILPVTSSDGAQSVAQRLHERIQRRVYSNGYDATQITISQGICVFDHKSKEIKTPEDLIRCADIALYQAKDSGRNAIVSYKKASIRRRPAAAKGRKKVS